MPNTEEKWKELDQLVFLRENGVWIGLPGCSERMDNFASIFMQQIKKKNNEDNVEEVVSAVENWFGI